MSKVIQGGRLNPDEIESISMLIQHDLKRTADKDVEAVAIAWAGYLAALLEWGISGVGAYDKLVDLLPPIADNPVLGIFLGREEDDN